MGVYPVPGWMDGWMDGRTGVYVRKRFNDMEQGVFSEKYGTGKQQNQYRDTF